MCPTPPHHHRSEFTFISRKSGLDNRDRADVEDARVPEQGQRASLFRDGMAPSDRGELYGDCDASVSILFLPALHSVHAHVPGRSLTGPFS